MTAAALRAPTGDPASWMPADFDAYEITVKTTNPAFDEAAATGRFVLGLHAEDGQVVVDLATAESLAARRLTATVRRLMTGTTRSSKTLPLSAPATAA
ncbi:hypothetical protein ACH4TP_38140 [Streptomyces sp. NPDC021012]|uniref:hypothetical protein n=1 Tax=Streptomyces sp. NPDC021012 TaxID=3365107 RepID=UPI0037999400